MLDANLIQMQNALLITNILIAIEYHLLLYSPYPAVPLRHLHQISQIHRSWLDIQVEFPS